MTKLCLHMGGLGAVHAGEHSRLQFGMATPAVSFGLYQPGDLCMMHYKMRIFVSCARAGLDKSAYTEVRSAL